MLRTLFAWTPKSVSYKTNQSNLLILEPFHGLIQPWYWYYQVIVVLDLQCGVRDPDDMLANIKVFRLPWSLLLVPDVAVGPIDGSMFLVEWESRR